MFPAIQVQISGMDRCARYALAMDVVPVNEFRYRFHSSRWTVAGTSAAAAGSDVMTRRIYIHPDSPMTGQQWMSRCVSFVRLKLTNNLRDSRGYIILNSMRKYQPRCHVIQLNGVHQRAPNCCCWTYSFNETQFIAVTSYQNDQITQLKIDNNPFAKRFRSTGARKREKKMTCGSYHVDVKCKNRCEQEIELVETFKQRDRNTTENNNEVIVNEYNGLNVNDDIIANYVSCNNQITHTTNMTLSDTCDVMSRDNMAAASQSRQHCDDVISSEGTLPLWLPSTTDIGAHVASGLPSPWWDSVANYHHQFRFPFAWYAWQLLMARVAADVDRCQLLNLDITASPSTDTREDPTLPRNDEEKRRFHPYSLHRRQ